MALPDSFKTIVGTDIILADTTDHAPGASASNNLGTRTDQIDCTDLAANTARQSAKIDFGANRDLYVNFGAAIEWEVTPEVAATDTVEFYLGYSNSVTTGMGNSGGCSGSDAAYAGYSAGGLGPSLLQLYHIGSMRQDNVISTDETQVSLLIASFRPRYRYGMLVVHNAAVAAAFHSDMIETSFIFAHDILQLQD